MGNSSSDISASNEVDELPARHDVGAGARIDGARTVDRYATQGGAAAATRALPEVEDAGTSSSSASRGGRDFKGDAVQENAAGVKCLNSGLYEEAVSRFKQALTYDPSSVQILDNIGLAYAKMQDYSSAYEWYEKAHKQNPHDVETLFSLAWVERKRQRYTHARELFVQVLEIEPGHTKALWLLGDILKTSKDFEGAIRQFELLIRGQPKHVDGHLSLASCLEATKQYTRAAQVYTHVLQHLSPSRPVEVHFSLAKVYYQSKQYRQAVLQFERVPDSDPRSFEAKTTGAKACRELEDHERAIALAEGAARAHPHPDVMHFLGEECIRIGDQQKAAYWFGRGLELEPNHLLCLHELGQLTYRQSKWQDAEQYFTRICELDKKDTSAVRWLALVKYKLRKEESCRQCCEALLRSDPLNTDALWLLAELQVQGGSTDDRWYLNLRLPAEATPAAICQSIVKGYIIRKQVTEANNWLKKVLNYLPNETRLYEAQQLLIQKGATVNPQDIIDLLDQRSASSQYGSASRRWRTGKEDTLASLSNQGYPGLGLTDDEDLERLLRRAERASRPNGLGAGVASDDQKWREVLSAAKATLRRKPEDALALCCAARALLSIGGDSTEIREYARQAAEYGDEAAGFTLGYELHAYLGAAAERERNAASAEKHFAAALSSKAGDETAMLGLARALAERRECKLQAKKLLEQVLASNPGSVEGHVRLAEMALEAEDAGEAYRLAAQAVKLAPSDAAAQLCLGQASLKLGRSDDASRTSDQAGTQASSDPTSTLALASSHRKAGRTQDAINCYKRVLDVRPGDYECALSLAQLHAERGPGGASQAVHYFRTALQSKPSSADSKDIYLQMATVQCGISAWKDAQQTLEGAVRELPQEGEVWCKLLTVYEKLKDSRGQHQCHRHLAQLGAATAATRISYAELLLGEDRVREAREQLQQVLRAEPANTAALLKLAQSHRQDGSREGNLEEARLCYEQVLQLSPTNAEALEGAAYCHRKSNNTEQAIQLYQQCLKVSATAEGPLYYLGDILYKQHRHAECQHYLTRLVDTNCGADYKTGALYLLAKSHVSLDEHEEAEKHARAGLALKASLPHFLFILALVQNRMADFDASISTLKKALQNCGPSEAATLKVEIHDWLAQAYERKGEYVNAKAELDLALKQDPSHVSSLITLGLVHIQLKDLEQAETSFRRALAVEKNHALALVRLGYCKLLSGDLAEATTMFQRALQQRCGTVALPRSVKGTARIYMALTLYQQQDVEGAIYHLSEARKSHRNFESICKNSRDMIVAGHTEGMAGKIRGLSDLDVNVPQAWQLVELMAKELEQGFKDGPSSKPGGSPQASPEGPKVSPQEGQGRQWLSAEVASGPASAQRRSWVAPSDTPAVAAQAVPERRQWTARTEPEPAAVTSPAPVAKGIEVVDDKKLKLEKHEEIDFSQLKQHECLGSGGFGAVYRGYFQDKEVAIKKLFCEDGGDISPLQLEELEKEVAALRSLDHPRLVKFIGACLQPPNLCIITEFMAGGSLHHLLHKAKTPLTLAQQAKMALQVCDGVGFLHSSSPPVVHRDLKSLNIVLDRIYNAKICDFGLTQSMDKTHISLKEGGAGGSPRYMAPECYDCKGKITEKVDVWALGCILVEIFGGPLPYDDCSNIQQIVAKVLIDKEVPYIPNHLPKGVRPIVQDCFSFDIKQRASAPDVYSRMSILNLLPAGVAY
eukprot:TRINITY_DN33278_c0_g1_i1.p1 TRINITY_DN33278_c0_g1~~TRINITY_DN33278_c0_g1_i1.p1  ORF type:complete len:1708 (-),score=448.60 TRINITY_DN33278_c0_g1_i1:75-5198(-)